MTVFQGARVVTGLGEAGTIEGRFGSGAKFKVRSGCSPWSRACARVIPAIFSTPRPPRVHLAAILPPPPPPRPPPPPPPPPPGGGAGGGGGGPPWKPPPPPPAHRWPSRVRGWRRRGTRRRGRLAAAASCTCGTRSTCTKLTHAKSASSRQSSQLGPLRYEKCHCNDSLPSREREVGSTPGPGFSSRMVSTLPTATGLFTVLPDGVTKKRHE